MASSTENTQPSIKNKITILAVLAFAVALCCIFAFMGNKSENESLSSEALSADAVSDVSQLEVIGGCGVYVDGYFVAAAPSSEAAEIAVSAALDARVSVLELSSDAVNSFTNSIEFVEGYFVPESFTADISSLLEDDVTDYSGNLLPVTLSVTSVTTYTENVILEYETKTIYTDSMKDGAVDVISEGFNGEGKQTYEVISVDGVETQRNAVSLEVTTETVDEILRVGSRSDGMNTASVMNFVIPYDGFISSYMGPRWGTVHNGLDICKNGGCYGDPVAAACGGTVIKASDTGDGYGYCVIIDHGNGVKTLYAHLSAFSVEVGDIVDAGDEVGLIGSTGYSLGPHLHFEVRIDDVPVNPLLFVDYE